MERNLRLYPLYAAIRGLIFWLPVFFLYFQERLTLGEALWLEAVYYTAFVLLEVPSGYLSDAVGRRPTLVIGASLSALGCAVFALGASFEAWALGQLLFAAGFAFDSGTDQSLLYDSLAARGKEDRFRNLESRAASLGLSAVAVASLGGGLLGSLDLRLAYVATGIAALGAAWIATRFTEPPRTGAGSPTVQLAAVGQALRSPLLRWTMAAAITGTVLNHVPYEFLQPWLAELLGEPERTALASGALSALIVGISALAAARSDALAARFGAEPLLLAMIALQTLVIAAMATTVAWWVLPLALARGVPGAVMRPVLGGLQHPLLSSEIRATTLSLQSLIGRLSFGISLLLAGQLAGLGMGAPLLAYAGLALLALLGLGVTRRYLPMQKR